jgi:hypothetical protein
MALHKLFNPHNNPRKKVPHFTEKETDRKPSVVSQGHKVNQ